MILGMAIPYIILLVVIHDDDVGFISVVLSSLERRYQLTGTQVGLIASVFDMAVIVTVLFISYFGGKGHKPRWMGVSLLIQGLGMLDNYHWT